jgi:hypothetical protein
VRALTGTVPQIMRTGRTDARVPPSDPTTRSASWPLFNAMLDRIDAVLAGMRGALDNVAHDLRTPMTRLRAIAEAGFSRADPEEMARRWPTASRRPTAWAMLSTLMDISEAETGTMRADARWSTCPRWCGTPSTSTKMPPMHKGVTIAGHAPTISAMLADGAACGRYWRTCSTTP